jgi:Fe-S-cluster containining protein
MNRDLIGPANLLKRIRIAVYDAGAEMRKLANQLGEVSCKRSCDNCCRQKVLSTPAEGLAIFLYLNSLGRWSDALEARLEEDDAYATKTNHADWFKEKRPCPFLKDGACGVYPVRPVGCIATFSTGDPQYCGRSDIESRIGHGQMQINAPLEPGMLELVLILLSLDNGIPGAGFMTLSGAVLAGARHATKRPERRALVVEMGLEGTKLIDRFDAEGKDFQP